MDPIYNFTVRNKLRLKSYHKKILIADRALPEANFINSIAAYILNEKHKFSADVITNVGKKNIYLNIYAAFNINRIFFLPIKYNYLNFILLIKSILYSTYYTLKIFLCGSDWFIKKFKYKDIYFGDLFYDTYAKLNLNYTNKNLLNFNFYWILIIGIYKINLIEKILNKNDYDLVLSSTNTFTSVSALTARLALKKKIKVICLISNIFKSYDNIEVHRRGQNNIKRSDISSLNKKKVIKIMNLYLQKRFNGKIKERDVQHAFYKKKKINNKEKLFKHLLIEKNKKYKKLGLLAVHSFHDLSYGHGDMLFLDYYDHFIKTIDIIKKSKDTFWLVRPHPTSKLYPSSNIVKNYIKKIKSDNLKVVDESVSTEVLLRLSDKIVTCNGSIALEAGYFKKKVILAGKSFYSDLKFSYLPKNKSDYQNLILNKKKFAMTSKEKTDCLKAFYKFIFRNSNISSKILPIDKFLIFKKNNFYYNKGEFNRRDKSTYKNYFKLINKNLEKFNIKNDNYYLKLENFLTKNV
jgi:hypothetical protein